MADEPKPPESGPPAPEGGDVTYWHGRESVTTYRYKSKWPHAGAGVRVQF